MIIKIMLRKTIKKLLRDKFKDKKLKLKRVRPSQLIQKLNLQTGLLNLSNQFKFQLQKKLRRRNQLKLRTKLLLQNQKWLPPNHKRSESRFSQVLVLNQLQFQS